MLLYTLALAEEAFLQIVGAGSRVHARVLFVKDYSCGKAALDGGGLVECYDLGKNYFATLSIAKDSCSLYHYLDLSFASEVQVSSCMSRLLLPVSAGQNIEDMLFNLKNSY